MPAAPLPGRPLPDWHPPASTTATPTPCAWPGWYCTALGLPEGRLLYAKGNAPHTAHRVRHAGAVIHQHALDLDQQPAALLADISAIARGMVSDLRV